MEDVTRELFSVSVICCRVSPKQKALVTRLVKEGTGKTTLAIGDGANDVGMIKEADIEVGISGVEGMWAVMAGDFSIAQFRFLERLLVVHGHWCYKRITQMVCYFFYKNIAFGLTLFYFEAFAGFSGQSVYDDWYMLLFNVVLTSLPVISLGAFEQDVSSEICLTAVVYIPLIIFFLNIIIFYDQAFRAGGQTADMDALGTTMFTCIIWALNCQIVFTMSHFTWIQHLFIWGSIPMWYMFLFVYGMLSPTMSGNAYQLLVEALALAPMYWMATLLVTITCNLPYWAHISYQRCFRPLDHHIIQEISNNMVAINTMLAYESAASVVSSNISQTGHQCLFRSIRNHTLINVDGAFCMPNGEAAIDFVARDHYGMFVGGVARKLEGPDLAETLEAHAFIEGQRMTAENGWQHTIVERDALSVVNGLNSPLFAQIEWHIRLPIGHKPQPKQKHKRERNQEIVHGHESLATIDSLGVGVLDPPETLPERPFHLAFNCINLLASNPFLPLQLRISKSPAF
ncbi:hypothetical protein F3Y22_tig00109921pilonHSYRG00050 [Hibiscus syriacus]|uniref:Uncharacterized protein n=1 Tax=Hibiscus syriacus TaxID=106335 RepID=A0A6A3BYR4_HIBSY|nr:hypothetical protein F3Y22_tig00109921pilonHSYRG00050 [Hibiscus syriacus]